MADDTSVVSVSQISCGSSHSCALLSKCLADVPCTLVQISKAATGLFGTFQLFIGLQNLLLECDQLLQTVCS
jgi:hypothetical protein